MLYLQSKKQPKNMGMWHVVWSILMAIKAGEVTYFKSKSTTPSADWHLADLVFFESWLQNYFFLLLLLLF